MNDQALLRMRQVVKNIVVTSPFFTQLAMKPTLKEIKPEAIPGPMATNGKIIWYNPDYIMRLPMADLEYVFKHEILHRVLGHCSEDSAAYNQECRNIAHDLAINGIMMEAEKRIPDEKILPGCYPGIGYFRNFPSDATTDTYYELLMKDKEEEDKKSKKNDSNDNQDKDDGDKDDSKDSGGNGGDTGDEGDDGNDSDEESGKDSGNKKKGDESEDEEDGDGSDGSDRDSSEGDGDSDGVTDVEEEDEEDEEDERSEEEKVADALRDKQSARNACADVVPCSKEELSQEKEELMGELITAQLAEQMNPGSMTGSYAKILAQLLAPPSIPWKKQLRSLMTSRERRKLNYHKPSRRYRPDIIMPRKGNRTLGKCVVVSDTSGSMQGVLPKIAAELQGLVHEFPDSELYLILCDSEVQGTPINIGRGQNFDFSKVTWYGGGGTCMCPGFDAAAILRPDLIICATDMAIPRFPKRPLCPVVWCIADIYNIGKNPVPYGNKVIIPPEECRRMS